MNWNVKDSASSQVKGSLTLDLWRWRQCKIHLKRRYWIISLSIALYPSMDVAKLFGFGLFSYFLVFTIFFRLSNFFGLSITEENY
jgi:hypothetical protein